MNQLVTPFFRTVSLISAGRLMEAGFGVIFGIPKDAITDEDAITDGFHPTACY